ncbi:LysR substrate-binding domain-containing protein [Serratia sp. DD3]|uniref:LysR substrate-binding domain-containing protein n=1 Tax=Serratia sp. DD3 TaxID=1410619 RepID=UPI0003C5212E|nr:LysR substrate-binding domain-containing protein [Serratia sp. DD3]KEY57632.1 HTH-type transcriptional regulator DmlR [Serratia sp. DD3]
MQIDLSLSDRFVDPIEEGIEVMIRIGELADSSLIARALAPYRLITCASPSYLSARGLPETPDDLAKHDCLMYGNGASSISCRWHFTHHGKVKEVPVNGRFRCNDWKALLSAATAGFGITLGPESILEPEVKAGRLVRILSDYEGPARPMHVVYPASRKPTIKLRSFVDALMAEFRPEI